MSKLRVLWLSDRVFSGEDKGQTGTWLCVTAQGLVETGEVVVGNIGLDRVTSFERRDFDGVQQWVGPLSSVSGRQGELLSESIVRGIRQVVEDFAPDLIQVWGTEYFWGLFTARRIICKPALLEMQGLKCAYARVFNGDLGFAELLRCIRPKDVVRRSSVFSQRAAFKRWTSFEREIIKGHRFVGTQSDWIDAWVKSINPSCTTFRNDVVLRAPFYGAQWREPNSRNVFCSAAYPVPYKGLHVAIRALAHLTPKFPDVQLRIAGLHQRPALRQTGYVAWLNRQLRTLGLCDRVIWLGALNAAEIVREMRGCAAMVLPTFIENYCTAMQEAMSIGVPLVASYAGGLPSLARDEQSCLFFPPGDEVMCAHQLGRLLSDPQLSHRISGEAHRIALARNEPQKVLARQIEIYRQVLGMAGDEN